MRISNLVLPVFALVALQACSIQPASPGQSADSMVTELPVADSVMSATGVSASADSVAMHIAEVIRTRLVKDDVAILTRSDRNFVYSQADLNGDGQQESFVAMKGSYFCGNAGCTVFLLNKDFERISTFTIVSGPVQISNNKSKGWNDLIIPSRGRSYKMVFDGKKYPGNPSVQPEFSGAVPASAITVLPADATVYQF